MRQERRIITAAGWPETEAALHQLSAGAAVTMYSQPGAGAYAGPTWWLALVAKARTAFPALEIRAVLDCGNSPGAALAAIRAGVEAIALDETLPAAHRIAEIAEKARVMVNPVGDERPLNPPTP